MTRGRALLVAVLALPLLHAGAASADDEDAANKEFSRGVELYRAKKYRDAAEAFVRAERLAPRGPTAFNAARAFKAAGETLRVGDELAAALRYGGLSDDQRKDAAEQLRVIELTTGSFEMTGPKDATVRVGAREERVPTRIHVQPGAHTIQFTSGAATDEQQLTIRRGERLLVEMRFVANPSASIPLPPPVAAPTPSAPEATAATKPDKPSGPVNVRKPIAIGLMAAGGVAFISAIAVGLSGLDARDRFIETGRVNASLRSDAESKRTTANVLGALGLLAIGGGVVLFFTAPNATTTGPTEPRRSTWVGLNVAPNGAALVGTLP